MVTVGRFAITAGVIAGPHTYMSTDRYHNKVEQIQQGNCHVTNEALRLGHPVDHAVAVALQTDYAAWCGLQQLHAQYPSTIGGPQ